MHARRGAGTPARADRHRYARVVLLVASAAVLLVLLPGYPGTVQPRLVAVEALGAAALAAACALAPTRRARQVLGLLTAYWVLTATGDLYWLLTVDPTGLSFAAGEHEPGPTVALTVARYAAPLGMLALTTPATGGRRWTWRRGVSQAQVTVGAAALVLLVTPVGALVDDGRSYSLFCFFDVVVAAAALGAVVTSAWATPRPKPGTTRALVLTAAGVSAVVLGDAAVLIGLTTEDALTGGAGVALGSCGTLGTAVVHLAGAGAPAPLGEPLPRPAAPAHPHLLLAVTVATQAVVPLAVSATAAARLAAAPPGSPGAAGAATLGTAAAALVLTVLTAVLHGHRAQRAQVAAAGAQRDELTGAHSRRGLADLVRHHLGTGTATGTGGEPGWTLVLMDLDGFKAVNDGLGHDAGDEVLRAVVRRAADVVAGRGAVARLGGDEFVVLLRTGPPSAPATAAALEALRAAAAAPVALPGGCSAAVGASLGAVPAGPGADLAALLTDADRRMYTDKHQRHARRGTSPASPATPAPRPPRAPRPAVEGTGAPG
ncbi:diguanylate cyclase [Kineococcus gypseus]|uniref:GGDEF domain-containing protein n=1 Tax=Kineococcus gypseus TaxID=1637102 RepID=UPI003D7E83C8